MLFIKTIFKAAFPVTLPDTRLWLKAKNNAKYNGSAGGKATARKLTKRQRSLRAKKAANARWNRERERTSQPESV